MKEKRSMHSKYLKLYRRLSRENRDNSDPLYFVQEFMELKSLKPSIPDDTRFQFKVLVQKSTIEKITDNPLREQPFDFEEFCSQLKKQDEEANNKLKEKLLKKGCKTAKDTSIPLKQKQCSICLEGFQKHALVKVLHCKHCYHYGCLTSWLEESMQCPVCRVYVDTF